jgi:hypothetical protein
VGKPLQHALFTMPSSASALMSGLIELPELLTSIAKRPRFLCSGRIFAITKVISRFRVSLRMAHGIRRAIPSPPAILPLKFSFGLLSPVQCPLDVVIAFFQRHYRVLASSSYVRSNLGLQGLMLKRTLSKKIHNIRPKEESRHW